MPACVIVVLPCFNEQESLKSTCLSLGFGQNEVSSKFDVFLIIVDNNSVDRTIEVAQEIKKSSFLDQVHIISETEQGVVPARITGNVYAILLSKNKHRENNEVLILQADADTIYPQDYIDKMLTSANLFGLNTIVEACVDYDENFRQLNYQYIALLEQTDARYEKLYSNFHDYVIDDKVVGYWLSDYITWGGHIREYTSTGDEIYAETTRLFLKAQVYGAVKKNIGSVKAFHSERKVIANPSKHFATAGFPREASWDKFWLNKSKSDVIENFNETSFEEALNVRALHLIALFYMLSIHIDRTLGNGENKFTDDLSVKLLSLLPFRKINDLKNHPALFLSDVFAAVDNFPTSIKQIVDASLMVK